MFVCNKKNIIFVDIYVNKNIFIMKAYSFENLEVWKASRKLVSAVYLIQNKFPYYEKSGLGDQIRRAAISIPSIIVEGNYRTSIREQIRFIEIAFASLMEVYCQLILAFDLKYITENQLVECKSTIETIRKMLIGLRFQKQRQLSINNQSK